MKKWPLFFQTLRIVSYTTALNIPKSRASLVETPLRHCLFYCGNFRLHFRTAFSAFASVIAAARADCGMLAQVGSAQPVAEGVAEVATLGRLVALSWLGCSGRPARRWWPPTPPPPPLRAAWTVAGTTRTRPGGGVFAQAGWFAVAGFAQNHPAPPLPCLLPCLFAHPQNRPPSNSPPASTSS